MSDLSKEINEKPEDQEEWKITVVLLEDYYGSGQVKVDINPPIAAFVLG